MKSWEREHLVGLGKWQRSDPLLCRISEVGGDFMCVYLSLIFENTAVY